jgi:hypothetical protein
MYIHIHIYTYISKGLYMDVGLEYVKERTTEILQMKENLRAFSNPTGITMAMLSNKMKPLHNYPGIHISL